MKKALVTIIFILLVVAVGRHFLLRSTPFGTVSEHDPGPFDRKRFESVVHQVRSTGIKAGQKRHLRLDDLSNPMSLRAVKPNERFGPGQGTGNVWAEMTRAGNLKVVIETRDLGHVGEYGFAYSQEALIMRPFGEGWLSIDVPGQLNLVTPNMRIDDNWWQVGDAGRP